MIPTYCDVLAYSVLGGKKAETGSAKSLHKFRKYYQANIEKRNQITGFLI